jgi:hypothetical protein
VPVNTHHKEYDSFLSKWERCRDCYEGSDAVKTAGEKYLPALDSHKQTQGKTAYEGYKTRALFFNATGRTIDGFAGAVFQKEPVVKVAPEATESSSVEVEVGPDGRPLPPKLGPDGKPLPPKLGPDGKPLKLGPDGEPNADADADTEDDGKPVRKLGPDGKPVRKFGAPDQLGPDGKPLPEDEEEGTSTVDEQGRRLGPDGKPVPALDENGEPVLDENGEPTWEMAGAKEESAPESEPKQKLDENGEPIPVLDENGEPKLDENGEPEYEMETSAPAPFRKKAPGAPEAGVPGAPKSPKPPENPILKQLDDITLTGQTLDQFGFETMQEVLTTGRYGILVDMADTELRDKQRPYWAGYDAESIINWTTDRIEGEETLIRVVLCEQAEIEDPMDPFTIEEEEQYRVLELEDGVYSQTLWAKGANQKRDAVNGREEKQKKLAKASGEFIPYSEKETQLSYSGEPTKTVQPPVELRVKSGDDWHIIEKITPVRRGKPLDFIPFYFVNATGTSARISKPPLLDLVDLNLSHYRTMADLEHGRHFSGLPTPWISGPATNDANEVQLGPSGVLILEKGGSAGMLQSSTTFPSLETADEQKRKMMAVLGARLLEEQAMANETLGAVGMRHSGEQAVLRTIVQVLEQQLTKALRVHVWWLGTEKTPADLSYVQVELNKDFFSVKMQPPELAALLAALQADGISYKTFYHNLSIGGITRPGVTDEEERQEIANKPDAPAAAMPNAPGPGDLNSMIYNDPDGNPLPNPMPNPNANPMVGVPNAGLPAPKKTPPKGVIPPGLRASAAAAKKAAGRTISVKRDANGRAAEYRIS